MTLMNLRPWSFSIIIQAILLCLSFTTSVAGSAPTTTDSCDADVVSGGGARPGPNNATTAAARQIANEFQNFFEVGIRDFDESADEQFATLSHVSLWHKAISELDIPDVANVDDDNDESSDECEESNLSKMHRLLSSVMAKISSVAYPDPSSPLDPHHDWKGPAGGGRKWRRAKNRANHDSLNHMRTSAIDLYFVHLVKEHRPDVWKRILKARGIQEGTEDERLYLLNLFVGGYFILLLRANEDEFGVNSYHMTEDGRRKLMQYFSPGGDPERAALVDARHIPSVWLLQRLAQTDYYRSLLGKYANIMVTRLVGDYSVKGNGELTDENGDACLGYYLFLYDAHEEQNLETLADETLAERFEAMMLFIGHFIDHIRINYSHVTKPKGCGCLWIRHLFETIFGSNHYMQRFREIYSFWTYLTQQAGILSNEEEGDSNDSFRQMKSPNEIKLDLSKTFFESNPWAPKLQQKWLYLAKHSADNEDQKKFRALCENFDAFFSSFFDTKHLRDNLDEATATFFEELFSLSGEGGNDVG